MDELQQLRIDNAALSISLGRMTAERDAVIAQRDEARGRVIGLQRERAEQSRTADQLRQQAREHIETKDREWAAEKARVNQENFKQLNALREQNKDLIAQLEAARLDLGKITEDRDRLRGLLEKHEPTIRLEKAQAELAALEREEMDLASRKERAKRELESAR